MIGPLGPIAFEAAPTLLPYEYFLRNKHKRVQRHGFDVPASQLNDRLFPFQRDIVRWALRLGKAAIFAAVGLGKTPMQLEWARHVAAHTGGQVIILAPLAVAAQTVREGAKFGIEVVHVQEQSDVQNHAIVITNYERMHLFDLSHFAGVVLDESSILKAFTGKTKRALVEACRGIPYKLACTATPAPNDHTELGNHAEFLDVMNPGDMLTRWFINDMKHANVLRLKRHGEADFWRWLTSWAVCISKPRDLGEQYDMPGFDLPSLHIEEHHVAASRDTIERAWQEGRLIPDTRPSSTNLHKVRRESLGDRLDKVRELVAAIPEQEPVLLWCDTNYEADALAGAFPDALEVRGSDSASEKERKLMAFSDGEARMLITKPSIAGFGLNWQHCNHAVFFGLSYSFEAFHQAIGRNYRFGQTRPVYAHVVYAETEGNVIQTLHDKQAAYLEMQTKMNRAMHAHGLFRSDAPLTLTAIEPRVECGERWTLHLGDCVPTVAAMGSDSIDFSVYSPPFANLYSYSSDEADMGNAEDTDEFMQHYGEYLLPDLLRVTRPGRLTAVHCKDLQLFKNRDGWFGIEDLSGRIVQAHLDVGWVLHSRITIWRDPVDEMHKTNAHGLLHKNFVQRAQVCRVGMPEYVLVFAKPDPDGVGVDVQQMRVSDDYIGTEPPPKYLGNHHTKPTWYPGSTEQYNRSIAVWQQYASPVWFDINPFRVLNYQVAKDSEDEKHIAPLPLDIAARCIDLWTNPGEVVLSPFAGVGSEGDQALRLGRRFVGVELKESYFEWAVRHLKNAEQESRQETLFEWAKRNGNGAGETMSDAAVAGSAG